MFSTGKTYMTLATAVLAVTALTSSMSEAGDAARCQSSSGDCSVEKENGPRGRVEVAIENWSGHAGDVVVHFPSGTQQNWVTPGIDDMQEDKCKATCESDTSISCSTPNTNVGLHMCGGANGGITCNWLHPGFAIYSVHIPCP